METTNLRFTFRQQEFARLYASGYPAARAAIYTGYARSTAETNAARLLANPSVQAYIHAHRNYHLPNHPDDQEAELARHKDPIAYLTQPDGYADSERWWEARLENHPGHAGALATILHMMTALRQGLNRPESEETLLREAFMRETIRQTQ